MADGQATAESTATIRAQEDGVVGRVLARRELGVFLGFLLLFGLIAVTRPDIFFNWDAISGIISRLLRQVSSYIIIGVGMTYLIIGGEFDLSIGSMFAVGGLIFAILLGDGYSAVVAILIVLLAGAGVGLANGTIVTKAGVPSLITTIGMLSVLRGVAFFLTPGGSRSVDQDLGLIQIFGGSRDIIGVEVTNQVFWALAVLIVFGVFLQRSRFGYHVYAVGDDEQAASNAGIDTDRVKIINFVLTGVLAALAGVISISYFGTMFGTAGSGFELLVIAAVVIGGTNLFGGEGTLLGTFLGALVIGVIPVLLVLNGFAVEIQEFLTGVVIIAAVLVDIFIRRRG
ncbi:ABC transporter permease [Salinigranum salinum]|uniref:ABC transporter permease n=1 Tax=Salinigranum salinum TaxID=1364937 RepID=UPI0012610923|nr:ABC transporter permease [Salinigranum salinum]